MESQRQTQRTSATDARGRLLKLGIAAASLALLIALGVLRSPRIEEGPPRPRADLADARDGLPGGVLELEEPEATGRVDLGAGGAPVDPSVPGSDLASTDGAEPAFAVDEAQRGTRPMVAPLADDYRKDFLREALGWPDGVTLDAGGQLLVERSWLVNPEGLGFDEAHRDALQQLVAEHDEALLALAETRFVLTSDALAHYFDSLAGGGWRPPESAVEPTEWTGLWNRSLLLRHRGYERRIRFDSAHYPMLEEHLQRIERKRAERTQAVADFLAGKLR